MFAWTQSRIVLPAWLGLGTALEAARERHGLETAPDDGARVAVLLDAVSNAEMALRQGRPRDRAPVRRRCGTRTAARDRIWDALDRRAGAGACRAGAVRGGERLLDSEPVLQASIDRRNPYVDPLSFVQIELLRRSRALGDGDAAARAAQPADDQRDRERPAQHGLMADGARSCEAAVEAFLEAVGDDPLRAWEAIDPDALQAEARRADALAPGARAALPLFGVLIGVKDNFDTVDLPTTYGSPIYRGHRPSTDAVAVERLRRAGALIAGKTALAEFASMYPPATLSPIDPARTPGGSSTGSAVAVAAGHVPVATGTQTAGSINRPASYCGVIGFKPSFGLIPMDGVKPLAPSLDTAGVLGRELELVVRCAEAMAGRRLAPGGWRLRPTEPPATAGERARIAFARTPLWDRVEPDAREAIVRVAGEIACEEVEIPRWFEELVSAQATLQLYEGARSLAREYERSRDQLSEVLLEALEAGRAITPRARDDADRIRSELGPELFELLHGFDAVVTPSAPGVPSLGTHTTGDPLFARAWNLIGAPSISLPLAWTTSPRLPVGLQLVGPPRADSRLLSAAASITVRV